MVSSTLDAAFIAEYYDLHVYDVPLIEKVMNTMPSYNLRDTPGRSLEWFIGYWISNNYFSKLNASL